MEGLIPFVYRAIVHYKDAAAPGGRAHIRSCLNESPSASYIRLPGDSGRSQTSDIQILRSDYGFGSPPPSTAAQMMASAAGVQSPVYRRRAVA